MRGVLLALGTWKRHWTRSDGVAREGEGAYDTISAWRNGQCAFTGGLYVNVIGNLRYLRFKGRKAV